MTSSSESNFQNSSQSLPPATVLNRKDEAENEYSSKGQRAEGHNKIDKQKHSRNSHEHLTSKVQSNHQRGEEYASNSSNKSNHNARGRGRTRKNYSATRTESGNSDDKCVTENKNSRTMSDSDTDSNDNQGVKKKNPRPFTERDLVTLSKNSNPDEVLLVICNSKCGFFEFIRKEDLDPNLVYYVVRLLCNISDATLPKRRLEILKEVEKNFLNNLNELLNKVSMKDPITFKVWNNSSNLSKLLINITRLLSAIMTSSHSSLAKCKSLITALKDVVEEHEVEGVEDAIAYVDDVFKREKQAKQSARVDENIRCGILPAVHQLSVTAADEEPPDDFRIISIFPTLEDLKDDIKPFLRANKEDGKYKDLNTYLDIQFRLLREDYIRPLRKGISDYRNSIKQRIDVKKHRDIRLYHNVNILRPVCSGRGINHVLQFDISQFKKINWKSSRRLLYGSLVCLSKDKFETMYYATITERDVGDLAQGNVQVHFENRSDLTEFQENDVFIMAETTAYFEAYRYILEGLKEIDEEMPLQRYILYCETNIAPPKYLQTTEQISYDFSCLLTQKRNTEAKKMFPVLMRKHWPSAAQLHLDSTQYEAFQQAITNELAVIQGPPGTGKTFIGLKIVKLLLKNHGCWDKSPILVVCYTNHALDQFLEGILQFPTDKLIRLGGRCQNPSLRSFTIGSIKRARKMAQQRNFRITQSERDCYAELQESEQVIQKFSNALKKTSTDVISFDKISQFMNEKQIQSFVSKTEAANCMSEWIRIFSKEEEFIPENLNLGEKYKIIWERTIKESVRELPKNERDSLKNPWDLSIGRRAELYKSWLSEVIANILSRMPALEDNVSRSNMTEDERRLIEDHEKSNKSILSIAKLLKYISSPKSRLEIQSLFAGRSLATDMVVRIWLYLSGSKKCIPFIKEALETLSLDEQDDRKNEITFDNGDDLEEDRKLDEDYDVLLDESSFKSEFQECEQKKDNEWILTVNAKQTAYKVKTLLIAAKKLEHEEVEGITDVWGLSTSQRRDLYAYWIFQYRQKLKENMKLEEETYINATEKLEEVRNMETIEIMRNAEVIGMTTTGAAKYRKLLNSVQPTIIIVEEAAEVLESHIITTLNKNCKHLILIGDHKQLRPSTTVYELSKEYKMDISLFERMVRNKIPCVTLQEQHRMRPEISCLLRHSLLYPSLKDHESVRKYEDIKGLDVNIMFIDHEEHEMTPDESTSYSNPYEAKYISGLCMYLICQGYSSSQITVITPYMAQVLLLRREMPKSKYDGVRITAVDNFQGEENDIILLSLVRSHSKSKSSKKNMIGFVGIENRICVSISRAKKGLYVLGNIKLLEENSPLWHDIIQKMRKRGAVNTELKLRCQNHPDKTALVKHPNDFEKFPDGGCGLLCGAKLQCGHLCPKFCHQIDRDHKYATCDRPCDRIACDKGHRCTKRCWQPCGDCFTIIEKTIPLCGHNAFMKCSTEPNTWRCRVTCTFILACGHSCNRKCHECSDRSKHEEFCKEKVEKLLPCKHRAIVCCCEPVSSVKCPVLCRAKLECSHICKRTCGTCFNGQIHEPCREICKKTLPCGHSCTSPCSDFCPPCNRPCVWICAHGSRCKKPCWQECIKCEEKCKFICSHTRCEKQCHELCNKGPCKERCTEKLKCGHTCSGMCGERCICIDCNSSLVRNEHGEKFDDRTVFFQLPDCKCIFDIDRLDRHIKESTREHLRICCPYCNKVIISHTWKYTNVLKSSRKCIVVQYRTVVGTDEQRFGVNKNLQSKLADLQSRGLTNVEVRTIQTHILDQNDFGALFAAENSFDRLYKILKIEKDIGEIDGYDFGENGLIEPGAIRRLLTNLTHAPANQFWREIDTEIERLGLGIKLLSCLDNASQFRDLYELLSHALVFLSEKVFDDNKKDFIKSVLVAMQGSEGKEFTDRMVLKNLKSQLISLQTISKEDASNNDKSLEPIYL